MYFKILFIDISIRNTSPYPAQHILQLLTSGSSCEQNSRMELRKLSCLVGRFITRSFIRFTPVSARPGPLLQSYSSDVEFKKNNNLPYPNETKWLLLKKRYGISSGTISTCKNQCWGSVTFWYESGSDVLYHWIMDQDPEPALFLIGFRDSNKK